MIALDGHLLLTAALAVATMTLWATGRIPEFLAGLMFFATAMITQVAPASVVFSGFSSAAFWLIVSGYVIGVAIRKTGLAERGALLLGPHLCRSYPRMVSGVIGLTYALAFVMPSNLGRIALLMPIVLALADRAGLSKGRPGRIGLALAVGFGTFQLSASILPANVPNLVLVGAVEQNFGIRLTYLSYFLLHAPVLGLLKGIVLIACIAWLFHDRPKPTLQDLPDSSLSPAEKRLAMLLAATLGLWLTDRYHGISAAWIGLAAACLCLMPKIGFVTGEEFSKEVNHRTAIYVAAILGLAAMVGHSGLGTVVGNQLLAVVPLDPAAPFRSFAALAGISAVFSFLVTANSVPALFTPLAQSLSDASGLPLLTVIMIQVVGYSAPLLPYQASPIVVAMQMGQVPLRPAMRLSALICAITFLVLLPIDYVWFLLLGWVGD